MGLIIEKDRARRRQALKGLIFETAERFGMLYGEVHDAKLTVSTKWANDTEDSKMDYDYK